MTVLQGGKGCCGDGLVMEWHVMSVCTCACEGGHSLYIPPQFVDDLPVVSDKGRAMGEHSAKNAVKIQLN